MLNTDANQMQTTLTKLVTKKINAATSRIKRIIMSEDSNNNPAEIFGEDGKIYYRRSGGDKTEVAGGWATDCTGIKPETSVTHVDMTGKPLRASGDNDLIFQVEVGHSIIIKKV